MVNINISEKEIMDILFDYDNNNANAIRSAGAMEYSLFELVSKKYMGTQYQKEVKEAINEGIIYAHDSAQELFKGINCFTLDPRFILKKGLRTHGDNRMGVTSTPPKHFNSAINLLEECLGLATTFIAGGVCIGAFNNFLAPFIEGLSDDEIKQVLQEFVFRVNQSHKNRGSQSMFSSVNINLTCPDFLKNEKAIGKGGVVLDKTYGEFSDEADRITRLFTMVMLEGDGEGKPIFFPNTIYNVDNADLKKYPEIFELSAKFSIPYFCSPKNNGVEYASVMGALTIDTPVMTNEGLKYPNELKIGDTVMTYNPDGTKAWNKLYNVIEKPAPDKVFKFTCENGYSFKVTENHKLPTKDGIKLSEDIKIGDELYNYVDKKEDYELLKEYKYIGLLLSSNFVCDEDKTVPAQNKRFPTDVWDNKNAMYSIIQGISFQAKPLGEDQYALSSSNKCLFEEVCFALSYLGYHTTVEKDGDLYTVEYGENYSPKTTTIVESIEVVDNTEHVYDLSVENNANYVCGLGGIHSENCRTELPSNWTGNPNIDCFNTGNAVYTTLSLPAVALKSKETNTDFFELLDKYSQMIHDYNINRFEWIHKLWYEYHVADFMIQEDEKGNPLYNLDNASLVLGVLGLNECCEILYEDNEVNCFDKAKNIIKYLRNIVDTWKSEDNLRWGLFATPAENASYKLAQKMVRKYGFRKSKAQGTADAPFYTNSTHVPVNYGVDLITRVTKEGELQPLTSAGNIENVYLGESYSTPEALMKFTERIRDLTTTYFWAYTTEYAICPKCDSTFKGYVTECPFDGEETDVYSRITGYLTNTKAWNKGKKQELKERYRYEAN